MPEGATVGASTGGVVGGTIGLLAGIGALAIPGLGPFIAAGPIMAALSGGAIGAGVGGLTGALVGLGIPEYEAKRYEGKVKEGGILISVHSESNDETNRAKDIFKEEGAHDISSTGEAHSDVKAEDVSGTAETRVPEVTSRTDSWRVRFLVGFERQAKSVESRMQQNMVRRASARLALLVA